MVLKRTDLQVAPVLAGAPNKRHLSFLFGLLGQENSLDVWQHTTLGDGHSGQQLVQLLVVTDGQLQVTGDDPGLLVVAGSISSQLQDLSGEVLHDGGQIDGRSRTHTFRIVSFAEKTVDTSDGELESSTR